MLHSVFLWSWTDFKGLYLKKNAKYWTVPREQSARLIKFFSRSKIRALPCECTLNLYCFFALFVATRHRRRICFTDNLISKTTILDKIDGKFVLPLQIKDVEKSRVSAFARLHPWFEGRGWGFAVPFYSVQDCSPNWVISNVRSRSAPGNVFYFLFFLSLRYF